MGNNVQLLTILRPFGPWGCNSEPARANLLQVKPPVQEDFLAQNNRVVFFFKKKASSQLIYDTVS